MSLLIPFARDLRTGDLIEITSSRRSDYADCVCPSCEQSLVPRLGNVKVWHFAHAPSPRHKPVRKCDLSFFSCCRQFVLEMARKGELSALRTPDFLLQDDEYPELSEVVTKGQLLSELPTPGLGSAFDMVFGIGEADLVVHLSYEHRLDPEPPADGRAGVLALELGYVQSRYLSAASSAGRIRQLVQELFTDATSHKRWIYHPRVGRAAQRLDRRRRRYEQEADHERWEDVAPVEQSPALVDESGRLTQEAMDQIIRGFRGPRWRRGM